MMKTIILMLLVMLVAPAISQACECDCENAVRAESIYWQVRYAEDQTAVTRLEGAATENPTLYRKFLGGVVANRNISEEYRSAWIKRYTKQVLPILKAVAVEQE